MRRLQDGKPKADVLPVDVERYLRKKQQLRTVGEAANERSLNAAVQAAKKRARR
jgi:hypothetical protein